jgi:hypothetical protein
MQPGGDNSGSGLALSDGVTAQLLQDMQAGGQQEAHAGQTEEPRAALAKGGGTNGAAPARGGSNGRGGRAGNDSRPANSYNARHQQASSLGGLVMTAKVMTAKPWAKSHHAITHPLILAADTEPQAPLTVLLCNGG